MRDSIEAITGASVCTYRDSGQTIARVDFVSTDPRCGACHIEGSPDSTHMRALLARARREGIEVRIVAR